MSVHLVLSISIHTGNKKLSSLAVGLTLAVFTKLAEGACRLEAPGTSLKFAALVTNSQEVTTSGWETRLLTESYLAGCLHAFVGTSFAGLRIIRV